MQYHFTSILILASACAIVMTQNETETSVSEEEDEEETTTTTSEVTLEVTSEVISEVTSEATTIKEFHSTTGFISSEEMGTTHHESSEESHSASKEHVLEKESFSTTPPHVNPEFIPGETAVHTALHWPPPEPPPESVNKTRVFAVDAECQSDTMKIDITFYGAFNGLIYTTNYVNDPACIYVNGTGFHHYEFFIQLYKCGTLNGGLKDGSSNNNNDNNHKDNDKKKYMWNTLTIQYDPMIEEDSDERFKVTCEYGYDFWKTVSFPVVDVQPVFDRKPTGQPLDFTLTPPECYMEIKKGFGLTGAAIQGSVAVGEKLTLIIHMRSRITGFDVIINNCVAHNGDTAFQIVAVIASLESITEKLAKSHCPVDEKLISEFRGKDFHGGVYETQVFAFFKAFRFTGSPALYLECDVRMCHGICPKQKCYWKKVQKRSIANENRYTTVSNAVKMMKALEVIENNENSNLRLEESGM